MEDYISISTLNDFIFCPYSIYLHNVYMDTDEGLYHATPQTKGRMAHETIDSKKASNRADDLQSLPVMSEEFGLMGKIDIYKGKEKKLIERKYQLRNIYQGQIFQLWAQYLCMKEMGYNVDSLAFYEISTNKMIPLDLPSEDQIVEFKQFLKDNKLRTKFAKMLRSQGAIRLQFSVYEVNNTQRIIDNIKLQIVDRFSKLFTGADSVLIFDAPNAKIQKFGNAIHRDQDVVYL